MLASSLLHFNLDYFKASQHQQEVKIKIPLFEINL